MEAWTQPRGHQNQEQMGLKICINNNIEVLDRRKEIKRLLQTTWGGVCREQENEKSQIYPLVTAEDRWHQGAVTVFLMTKTQLLIHTEVRGFYLGQQVHNMSTSRH